MAQLGQPEPASLKLVFDRLARRQLDAEMGAAAQTSSLEHITPAGGAHTQAKTMSFQSFTDFGLPCSLRHFLLLVSFYRVAAQSRMVAVRSAV